MNAEEFFKAKKDYARAKRRDRGEEAGALTLTSLMDVVSIIVVYLLKTYATDPILIQPIADQKIPLSSADRALQSGTPIYVTSKELVYRDKKVAKLNEGELDPGDVNQHLITNLYDLMQEEAEKSKAISEMQQKEWEQRTIIIGDSALKFSALVDIMFTAQRAGYTEYAFCVIQNS